MNAETTGDQASTESALTPPPELNTRVVIDVVDQDLCDKVHSCGWHRGVCSVGELPSKDGAIPMWGWRGEANHCSLRSDSARDSDAKEKAGRSRQQAG